MGLRKRSEARETYLASKWSAQLNINFLCHTGRGPSVSLVSRRRQGVAAAGAVLDRHLNPIHGRGSEGRRVKEREVGRENKSASKGAENERS